MTKHSALVVGASRGIGMAVVKQFAALEVDVVATWNSTQPDMNNPNVTWLPADITQHESVLALKTACEGQRFDYILINAGIYGPDHQNPDLVAKDDVERLFTVNAVAPVQAAKLLMPLLNDSHDAVIGIMSSRLASLNENTQAEMPLYAASKAALNMLSRSLAKAAGEQGVTLLSLHPGWVKTDMGGSQAPLEPHESAAGIISQLQHYRAVGGHHFVDYAGEKLTW